MKTLFLATAILLSSSGAMAQTECTISIEDKNLTSRPDIWGEILKIGNSQVNFNNNPEEIERGNSIVVTKNNTIQIRHNNRYNANLFTHALVGILGYQGVAVEGFSCAE